MTAEPVTNVATAEPAVSRSEPPAATAKADSKASAPAKADPKWVDARSQSERIAMCACRYSRSESTAACVYDKIRDTHFDTDDAYLRIELKIENKSDTVKQTYTGWANRLAFSEPLPRLVDNVGNVYKMVSFGAVDQAPGQKTSTDSIYPEKYTTDVLVFEQPVKK